MLARLLELLNSIQPNTPAAGLLLEGVRRLGMLLVIAVLAAVGYASSSRLIHRALVPRTGSADYERKLQRSRTLVPLLRSIFRYLISFVVGVAVLQQLGIDATAIVASAGVVGLAVGFGAQALVRDLISGLFLLFEGLIAVGDVIRVGEHTGEVEAIGIRVTRIRKVDGELRVIPNGQISSFGHLRRDFGRAVVAVGLPYGSDWALALQTLAAAGEAWAAEESDRSLEPPKVEGIVEFGASECTARILAKVRAGEQAAAEAGLRRHILEAFAGAGLAPAVPQRVVHLRRPPPDRRAAP